MRSSAGEHLVDIEGVTGSIPVASTIPFNNLAHRSLRALAGNWPETLLCDADRQGQAALTLAPQCRFCLIAAVLTVRFREPQ